MRLVLAFLVAASPAAALPAKDCEQLSRLNDRYWLSEKALSLVVDACDAPSSEACRRALIVQKEIAETPPVNALAVALLIARECKG